MLSGIIYPVFIIAMFVSVVFIICRFSWNPFYILIPASLIISMIGGVAPLNTISVLRNGFGTTMGYYGIIIIAGTAITVIMEKTGAIKTILNYILTTGGRRHSPTVLTAVSSVLSVSCPSESSFILFVPFAKQIEKTNGMRAGSVSIILATGIYSLHSLIPLSAGPVAAAGILNADLLKIFFINTISSVFGLTASFFWCKKIIPTDIDIIKNSYESSGSDDASHPSILISLLPLLSPLFLITLKTISNMPLRPFGSGRSANFIEYIGDPSIALLIGFFISLTLLKRNDFGKTLTNWINESINRSALLIIIAGAGGAFGAVLKATPLIKIISEHSVFTGAWLLVPFLISAAIKIINGSSMVAIITASSISATSASAAGLNPVFTASAVLAGSMIVSHINDPYFWIVSRETELSTKDTYKCFTSATFVTGLSSFIVIWIMSVIF